MLLRLGRGSRSGLIKEKFARTMVYFTDGKLFPGHRPRSGDSYKREMTKFSVGKMPQAPMESVESGRFHLIVCAACPWAHRGALIHSLKDLSGQVTLSVVSPYRDDNVGWEFDETLAKKYGGGYIAPTANHATGHKHLYEIYLKSDPNYTGNITTPVLFDAQAGKIVTNESWEVIRYLDRAFKPGAQAKVKHLLYPLGGEEKIDATSKWVQSNFNNAVYECGLAKSQQAYETSARKIFQFLLELETRLGEQRFLHGNEVMDVADLQLFPTLVRFDDVYHLLFKCSERRISSFYNLTNYLRELYQIPEIQQTVDGNQNKDHYYTNFTSANPKQIIPLGTVLSTLTMAHDRDRFTHQETSQNLSSIQENQNDANAKRARGEFVRGVSKQRRWIPGDLPAEANRYHLYVANNCPWCHRVMTARAVLGLEDVISVDVMFYRRNPDKGWQFLPSDEQLREDELKLKSKLLATVAKTDSINNLKYAPEIYKLVGSNEKSVPILFDKKTNTIVNNESAEIIRMFATGFTAFHRKDAPQLYPAALSSEIEQLNSWIYNAINNGAYKAGFSSSQESYEKAYHAYFSAFEKLDDMLKTRRFLLGENITEADVRLFPTVVRHDPVYYNRFKLNKAMVRDGFPNLHRWLNDVWQVPGVRTATDIDHCIRGYFGRTGNNLIPIPLNPSWY